MAKKEKLKNKKFTSVKAKLEYIQKQCLEPELFDDLRTLFIKKGFDNVKITHGPKEYGKDLVFSKYDEEFEEERWFGVIVKNKSATQNDFVPGNEIANQINLALDYPYKTIKGEEKIISKLFIVINGKVTDNAMETIGKFVPKGILPNIKIYDYQELRAQIEKFSKDSFLDNMEPELNLFMTEQVAILSDISNSSGVLDLKINDIDSIFVSVQTTYSRELKKIDNYISFDEDKDNKKKKNVDIEGSKEIINSSKNFIIHGIPTSGKTLFLKRIGINALKTKNGKQIAVFYFDIQKVYSPKFLFEDAIKQQYFNLTKGDVFDPENFKKIIVLIDSIDFLREEDTKIEVLDRLALFIESDKEKQYQIILATRTLDLIKNHKCIDRFEDTELLPFSFGQALQLVKKIIPNDTKKSNNFLSALKNTMLNTSLQRTPLALTLLAILYRDDHVDLKELPANIFALYNLFTDVYMDKWDASRGVATLYKYEQTKNILAFIAFHLHTIGKHSLNEAELIVFLENLRKKYNYDELNDISSFILHLKKQNGIFTFDKSSNLFNFFNHYFQEFFASLCIEDQDQQILIDNFFSQWWSNSVVFYCGKNPKSNNLHKDVLTKIVPITSDQKLTYISQHSKCLQASHSISIIDRFNIVKKILFEYNSFFETLRLESETNERALLNIIPFVSIINQSRSLFNSVFESKHVSTEEIIQYFEKILNEDNNLTVIANYNIAYFLSFHQRTAKPFEVFQEKVKDDAVWSRILFVDINLLNLKKKIDQKKYIRIRRKMNKNKFIIQRTLRNTVAESMEEKPKA